MRTRVNTVPGQSHLRLAQILREIEDRCATFPRRSTAALQSWAEKNWSLGPDPLIDLVQAGIRYCQLNGMDQTIGIELAQAGHRLRAVLDSVIDDETRASLFPPVLDLEQLAREIRNAIEPDTDSGKGDYNKGECDAIQDATDLVSHEDICGLVGVSRKRLQNLLSDWREKGAVIGDPCRYETIRPYLLEAWSNKSALFPKSFTDFKRILVERKSKN
jgi:hypothetical protein